MDAGDDLEGGSNLSLEQLVAKGDDLGKMLTEGWEWCVVKAQVEAEVPDFCCFLQAAYNSDFFDTLIRTFFYGLALCVLNWLYVQWCPPHHPR